MLDKIPFRWPIFGRQTIVDSEELTTLELAGRTAEKVNEVIDLVNGQQSDIDSREKSVDITNNRKLSTIGNFTGSLNGTAVTTVLTNIDNNADQIAFITEQFSDGATGLVVDAGFFTDTDVTKNYDGGAW